MRLNPDEESIKQAFPRTMGEDATLPPVREGEVRPLTDPEAVARWFGTYAPTEVEWEYDPFAPERMR
jgi:hypothetical protein